MLVHLKAAQASYIYDVYLVYTVPGKHKKMCVEHCDLYIA